MPFWLSEAISPDGTVLRRCGTNAAEKLPERNLASARERTGIAGVKPAATDECPRPCSRSHGVVMGEVSDFPQPNEDRD